MVHAALNDGATSYARVHYVIRKRFRIRYLEGTMRMRPISEDERTKMRYGSTCAYCGKSGQLSLDHVIPRLKDGPDAADNIIYACRSCNSSKGARDMVQWLLNRGRFPAVLVFRRYLKLAARWCSDEELMHAAWADVGNEKLPFDKRSLRVEWPPLAGHSLWPDPSAVG